MNKLIHWIFLFLGTTLLIPACQPSNVTLEDLAGDWVVYNWRTSDTDPFAVGTMTLQVEAWRRAIFVAEIPENDWDIAVGDVLFYELVENDERSMNATTSLPYLTNLEPWGGMNVEVIRLSNAHIEIHQQCSNCNGEMIMSMRRVGRD